MLSAEMDGLSWYGDIGGETSPRDFSGSREVPFFQAIKFQLYRYYRSFVIYFNYSKNTIDFAKKNESILFIKNSNI